MAADNLVLTLFERIEDEPVWKGFLRQLLALSSATGAAMVLHFGVGSPHRPVMRYRLRDPDGTPLDLGQFSNLFGIGALRPNRVYRLDELLSYDNAENRERQAAGLAVARVSDARIVRIVSAGDQNAWLILIGERRELTATDSALLSSIAPHVGVAHAMLTRLATLRLRAAMAEQTLGHFGIGQAAFDRQGRIVVADDAALHAIDTRAAAKALASVCAELEGADPDERRLVPLDAMRSRFILLRPLPGDAVLLATSAVAIGAVRDGEAEQASARAQVAAELFGLSRSEAGLAQAIADGRSIGEAADDLGLTLETARNYTKRIYAKTGARGQPDLVRMLLSGLAALG